MITLRVALVGFFSGILFALSWVIFVDGQTTSADGFIGTNVIPSLLVTLASIMINLANVDQVAKNTAVKVWLFLWFTLQVTCIGWGIYIIIVVYTPQDNYGGISVFLQTIFMMMAGLVFFLGRKNCNIGNQYDDIDL
jgi:hypothetical protein